MSVIPTPSTGLPRRHVQFLLILGATVVGWAAIIALCLIGQPAGAATIAAVWTTTCGLIAPSKQAPVA